MTSKQSLFSPVCSIFPSFFFKYILLVDLAMSIPGQLCVLFPSKVYKLELVVGGSGRGHWSRSSRPLTCFAQRTPSSFFLALSGSVQFCISPFFLALRGSSLAFCVHNAVIVRKTDVRRTMRRRSRRFAYIHWERKIAELHDFFAHLIGALCCAPDASPNHGP